MRVLIFVFFCVYGGIARRVKQQLHEKQKGAPSPAELRLIEKYMHEARPLEEGADEVALWKLVKSTTFKKFVQRLELENEVRTSSFLSLLLGVLE